MPIFLRGMEYNGPIYCRFEQYRLHIEGIHWPASHRHDSSDSSIESCEDTEAGEGSRRAQSSDIGNHVAFLELAQHTGPHASADIHICHSRHEYLPWYHVSRILQWVYQLPLLRQLNLTFAPMRHRGRLELTHDQCLRCKHLKWHWMRRFSDLWRLAKRRREGMWLNVRLSFLLHVRCTLSNGLYKSIHCLRLTSIYYQLWRELQSNHTRWLWSPDQSVVDLRSEGPWVDWSLRYRLSSLWAGRTIRPSWGLPRYNEENRGVERVRWTEQVRPTKRSALYYQDRKKYDSSC